VASRAFFCSGDQPPVFPLALRDGIALGDGAARSNALAGDPHAGPLDSRSAIGAAATAIGVTIAIGSMFTVVGTEVLQSYGWGLFVACRFVWGCSRCWCTATTSHDRSAVA